MRRLGNIGRYVSKSEVQKNVQSLAAAALLRKAGFDTVIDATKQYRLDCSTGVVATSSKDAFTSECIQGWMF